jgi:hypothetical protein
MQSHLRLNLGSHPDSFTNILLLVYGVAEICRLDWKEPMVAVESTSVSGNIKARQVNDGG